MATSKKPANTQKTNPTYENNPFYISLSGLTSVFEKARGVAILLIVISVLGALFNFSPRNSQNSDGSAGSFAGWEPEQWFIFAGVVAIILLATIFIVSMLSGISAYASAQVSRGRETSLSEAFHEVLEHFFSYIWLQIIVLVKVFLWTLLFIIPGIIMAYRYSLSNVAFFDKGLRGSAAVKESLRLTKGAWLTTYASQMLFNLITLGVISEFVGAGSRAVLYRQLDAFGDKKKPDAHILSWLTLLVPFILLALFVFFIILAVIILAAVGLVRS